MPESLDRLASALVERYVIERVIGAGGMATVYLARDVRHERPVALKVLNPELDGREFLMLQEESRRPRLYVVVNWTEELRRKMRAR